MGGFFATLFEGLLLFGPIRLFRIMKHGAERAAAFRAAHGREPTEPEWMHISREMYEEINRKKQ